MGRYPTRGNVLNLAVATDPAQKVSIIIPTYRRLELLKWCLRSVLAQIHQDWEALVVDDGSDDGTTEFLGRTKDARIRSFRQERCGAQAGRNLGVRESRGQFLMFLDDDDLLHPQKLASQLKDFHEDANLDCSICQTAWFREWPGDHNFLFNRMDRGDPITRFALLDVVWQTSAPLWRRDFVQKVGAWDERLTSGQDLDFHLRAACHEPKVRLNPRVLNFFREHPGTRITKDRKEQHPKNALIAMQNAFDLLRAKDLMTSDRGLAIASTAMRQSRTLALYGEDALARQAERLAISCHPTSAGRAAIRMYLAPLNKGIRAARNNPFLGRSLRKASEVALTASGLELKRPKWWQAIPVGDQAAIDAWRDELAPIRDIELE